MRLPRFIVDLVYPKSLFLADAARVTERLRMQSERVCSVGVIPEGPRSIWIHNKTTFSPHIAPREHWYEKLRRECGLKDRM